RATGAMHGRRGSAAGHGTWQTAGFQNACSFIQAEDGIRDRNVTGVQTCALPIFMKLDKDGAAKEVLLRPATKMGACAKEALLKRSEERRVGKGCRFRWWPDR